MTSQPHTYLDEVIDSILSQDIGEVLVVGKSGLNTDIIKYYEDNNIYGKKKNRAIELAQHENIVFLHDYIKLNEGWIEGFQKFGNDWDVCMTPVLNKDGSRFRDWCIWGDPDIGNLGTIVEPWCKNGFVSTGPFLAPYDYKKTEYMYISGAYFVAKKDFMKKNQFADLDWGHGEDLEWSLRVRKHWNYKLNLNSKASLLKQKDVVLGASPIN